MTTQTVNLKIVLNRGDTIPGMRAIAAESTATAQKMSRAQVQANTEITRSYERLQVDVIAGARRTAQAREMLGIRSENIIRSEINRTREAYEQMYRSGTFNARELTRAQDAMLRKVKELNAELRTGTTLQQKMQGLATAGLAVGAGAYVVGGYAKQAMSFERRLALRANTAYADRDYAGRKAGESEMRDAVRQAVINGMTKDDAMNALDVLVAGNQVGGIAKANKLLPFIAKVTTGQGASGADVSNYINSLISSGYAKDEEDAKRKVAQGANAAKAGSFEMPSMAKALPSLLPEAKNAGLTGDAGYRKLLVLLQQARTTSGSDDEAITNVRNLLGKLQAGDTAKDFKKAGRGDLAKYLMNQQVKGIDPLTAWQNVINDEIAKNPNLKPAINKLNQSKTIADREAAIEALKGMAGGQSIGKYFQDMQAKGALFGLLNQEFGARVNDQINFDPNIIQRDFGYISQTADYKSTKRQELTSMASMDAMDKLTPAIGRLSDVVSDAAIKHPLLTGAVVTGTAAISAMAGAAGLAALALGKIGAGNGIRLPAGIKRPGIGTAAGLAAGGALSYVAGQDGSTFGRYGGAAVNGAMMGATVGSVVPGLGTAAGAAIGGGAGLLYEFLNAPAKQSEPTKVETTVRVELADGLKATHQTSDKKGPVKTWIETGSVWSHP